MQKLTPFLWLDNNAEEAAQFYVSLFENSKVLTSANYSESGEKVSGQKKGSVMVVDIEIAGQHFSLLNGGPIFKINPSISFILNFDPATDKNAKSNLEQTWKKLSEGGKALMPLQEYPFSKLYGWIQDKYGVSWQLILSKPEGETKPFITPSIMFVGEIYGKVEEAIKFYMSVFHNSKEGMIARYGKGREPDKEEAIMYADFMLENQWFVAMESAHMHDFAFNEGVSFVIDCKDQKEVDYYWTHLIAGGGRESQCGWLKDKYGVSWQVVPSMLGKLMTDKDEEKAEAVMKAMLKMKKLDVHTLQQAYDGEHTSKKKK